MNTQTIWKFPLQITGTQQVLMPKGAQILSVQSQFDESPTLWAQVDPDADKETRMFQVYGTGHPIYRPEEVKYVGTCQTHGGQLVWHVYEVR